MIRQNMTIEIDWDIKVKDKKIFQAAQEAILHETLKSFTGIYQAKVTTDGRTLLTVFKPSDAMTKNMERLKAMRKALPAMKKKK